MANTTIEPLIASAIATGAQSARNNFSGPKSYHASGTTSAGSGAATILIQGSNDAGTTWLTIGTITLTLGTSATGDGFTSLDRFGLVRGNVTAISGTNATVSAYMAY